MNPVIHFELPYEDRERMAAFYRAAFGWKTEMLGEEMGHYVVVTTADKDARPGLPAGAIGGGFYKRSELPGQNQPSIVIAVEEIRAAMARVGEAGGDVLSEPMPIPGVGDYVPFLDTEGNRLGMLQPLTMQGA